MELLLTKRFFRRVSKNGLTFITQDGLIRLVDKSLFRAHPCSFVSRWQWLGDNGTRSNDG
jgi:hypothetical protein